MKGQDVERFMGSIDPQVDSVEGRYLPRSLRASRHDVDA